MNLLKLVLDPNILKKTCFLCFKQPIILYSLFRKLSISYELDNSLDVSLKEIYSYLFPFHDIVCDQACSDCADLLINMFTILKRNTVNKEIIKRIVNELNGKLNDLKDCSKNKIQIILELSDNNEATTPATGNQVGEECAVESNTAKHFKHVCKVCCVNFISNESLRKHKKVAHMNTNMSLVCEFCGKTFNKSGTLHAHLNTHKEKTCPYCFKILKCHSHFNMHIKNHKELSRRQRKKSYLHCNTCSYKSVNKASLEAHINKTHLKIKPYVCNVCGKGFYKKSNLTEHTFIHDNSKKTTCEVCGDSFFSKKTLMIHLRLHSNIKPFECEVCHASFVTSGRRLDHFKRRHMEKAVNCPLCDKKFSLNKELNVHFKKVHYTSAGESLLQSEHQLDHL